MTDKTERRSRRIKTPVTLRRRKTPSGLESLYLDIYYDGRRSYEFLRLYLVPASTAKDREANAETLRFAESIRAKRIVEIQNGRFGFENADSSADFTDWYDALVERLAVTESTKKVWTVAGKYLREFTRGRLPMREVTAGRLRKFRDWLETTARPFVNGKDRGKREGRLSASSRALYLAKVLAAVRRASDEGMIQDNPARSIHGYAGSTPERVYLSVDEIRKLARTECPLPALRRAFLFSCLTGLRCSDVKRLKWGDVSESGSSCRISFRQQKTGNWECLDITDEARGLLGKRLADSVPVFWDFHCNTYSNDKLREWCRAAGIHRKVTFHSARHSFAVMMLENGTDIYTVSKLLGHRSVRTTQVYAHITDKAKRDAVARIPSLLTD